MEEEKSSKGLTSQEAQIRLKKFEPNKLPQNRTGKIIKILKFFISPISLMLLAASLLSFYIGKLFDGYFILVLIFLNFFISFWQEQKADNAIKKLNEHLSQPVKTLRDSIWEQVPSENLVPGDIIDLSLGEVVPADCEVVSISELMINESALTGESLPQEKKTGDKVYSGAFVASGSGQFVITATGKSTYFGKTFMQVSKMDKKSVLEKDIVRISQFLSILSIIAVMLLSIFFLFRHYPIADILAIDLSILIAGIPISLPTVMTLIIEIGVVALAAKKVIVRRISSLQDLSNVSMLLTDKTGTLTENKIQVTKISPYGKFDEEQVLQLGAVNAFNGGHDPIDMAVLDAVSQRKIKPQNISLINFSPFNFKTKMSTAKVKIGEKAFTIILGAPQVVSSKCKLSKTDLKNYQNDVDTFARLGYRSLAVGIEEEKSKNGMSLAGVMALSDTLRPDAQSVISYMNDNSVNVAMLTGDNREIALQIAEKIGLPPQVTTRDELSKVGIENISYDFLKDHRVYAEILPNDKLGLVKQAKRFFVTAVTGDGVNDLPAAKAANVGIAVKNAVEALKNTADIVLLTDGIGVIKDAIFEARKIFARVYSYSVYRIAESYRLIITIALIGLLTSDYPLTVLQILILALLNDIPIISLAYDNVEVPKEPARIDVKNRFIESCMFGTIGVVSSMFVFVFLKYYVGLPWAVIQTVFFLKLTVSGHLLIYVAHTKKTWFKFLPSKQVILATSITQIIATFLAFTGFFMPARLSIPLIIFVWAWTIFFMQINELAKHFTVEKS